jgi:hypothetical protein
MGFISEGALLRFALAVASIGILLLALVVHYYATEELDEAKEVFLQKAGSEVSIAGSIKEVRRSGNLTQVTIVVEVPIVVFSNISLQTGQMALIQGRVADYDGKREIVANRLTYVN